MSFNSIISSVIAAFVTIISFQTSVYATCPSVERQQPDDFTVIKVLGNEIFIYFEKLGYILSRKTDTPGYILVLQRDLNSCQNIPVVFIDNQGQPDPTRMMAFHFLPESPYLGATFGWFNNETKTFIPATSMIDEAVGIPNVILGSQYEKIFLDHQLESIDDELRSILDSENGSDTTHPRVRSDIFLKKSEILQDRNYNIWEQPINESKDLLSPRKDLLEKIPLEKSLTAGREDSRETIKPSRPVLLPDAKTAGNGRKFAAIVDHGGRRARKQVLVHKNLRDFHANFRHAARRASGHSGFHAQMNHAERHRFNPRRPSGDCTIIVDQQGNTYSSCGSSWRNYNSFNFRFP